MATGRDMVAGALAIVLSLALCSTAEASDQPTFGLNLLLTSDHYDDEDYNEDHNGIGFTMHEPGDSPYSHTLMNYKNSEGSNSLSYTLTRSFGCASIVCFGGSIVVASGYSRGLGGTIAAAPFLSISIGPFRSLHLPGVVSAYGLEIPL